MRRFTPKPRKRAYLSVWFGLSFLFFFCAFVCCFRFFCQYNRRSAAVAVLYIFILLIVRPFVRSFLVFCYCNSVYWANCLSLHFTRNNHTLTQLCGVFSYWCSHYSRSVSRVVILPFSHLFLSILCFNHHFFLILRVANCVVFFLFYFVRAHTHTVWQNMCEQIFSFKSCLKSARRLFRPVHDFTVKY